MQFNTPGTLAERVVHVRAKGVYVTANVPIYGRGRQWRIQRGAQGAPAHQPNSNLPR